jgi:hypothetical protein
MAVVLLPDTLDLAKPVQVILHFHGWIFRVGDPYAGYLVATKGSSAPGGTVRDVSQEHWEQQISSLKGQGAQIVAILAQGRGKADFGSFPTFEYVRDVLEKSGRPELVKLAEAENYSVVLSAHSGYEGRADAAQGGGRNDRPRGTEVTAAIKGETPCYQQASAGRPRRFV